MTTTRWMFGTGRSAALAVIVVVVGSATIGALTSPAQQYLPDSVRSLANSAGGWSMFAFLLVWLSRARPVLGAVLGAVSFVLMVEAYGLVSAWRGAPFADPLTSMWIPIGLVAGPVIGVAAALTRHGSRPWKIAGAAVLSGILVAEGVYGPRWWPRRRAPCTGSSRSSRQSCSSSSR